MGTGPEGEKVVAALAVEAVDELLFALHTAIETASNRECFIETLADRAVTEGAL